jgi:ABC-type nitrate/sulfonate/bicarbonate transport system substrate-binding protein
MIGSKILTTAIYALLISIIWNTPAQAQLTKINVGYSAISGDALPAWLAKDAGIFERNGLDVQLVFFTGGTTAVMALVPPTRPSPNWPARQWLTQLWRVPTPL